MKLLRASCESPAYKIVIKTRSPIRLSIRRLWPSRLVAGHFKRRLGVVIGYST